MGKEPILYYLAQRPVYRSGMAPAHLGTRRQLRAERLSVAGLKPAAWLHYSVLHGICPLYERAQARPVRPLTERQRAALAAGRLLAGTQPCGRCRMVRTKGRYCRTCLPIVEAQRYEAHQRWLQAEAAAHERMLIEDRESASRWARTVLADPRAVILDTETTGLYEAWVVELAVVSVTGEVLLDTLINPQVPIPADATAIHGVTDAMVADAPRFAAVLEQLTAATAGRRVVIYNAAFDVPILRGELDRHFHVIAPHEAPGEWLSHPRATAWIEGARWECAMEQYAAWYGSWHDYWQSYTWRPLGGGHRARGDCEGVIEVLREMAAMPTVDAGPVSARES